MFFGAEGAEKNFRPLKHSIKWDFFRPKGGFRLQDFGLRGGVDCRVSDGRPTHASLVTTMNYMTCPNFYGLEYKNNNFGNPNLDIQKIEN